MRGAALFPDLYAKLRLPSPACSLVGPWSGALPAYSITMSRHLEAPEKSVRLVFRTGREVELVCVKAAGLGSKHECPQPVDDERMGHRVAEGALVLDAQVEALELELVDIDLAVAEVADEQ